MSDEPIQLTPGPSVGSFVKVSRYGEALWLKVERVLANKMIIAAIDNDPILWPYTKGHPVRIDYDEVIDWRPAQPGETTDG
jgi:hypothetical protein